MRVNPSMTPPVIAAANRKATPVVHSAWLMSAMSAQNGGNHGARAKTPTAPGKTADKTSPHFNDTIDTFTRETKMMRGQLRM
jgi:hypothetical protein